MALSVDVLKTFAATDTQRQVQILRRVGLDTDAADKVLGYLAGNEAERYRALMQMLSRDEPTGIERVRINSEHREAIANNEPVAIGDIFPERVAA